MALEGGSKMMKSLTTLFRLFIYCTKVQSSHPTSGSGNRVLRNFLGTFVERPPPMHLSTCPPAPQVSEDC